MGFINSPYQFQAAGNILDLGLLSSAGLSTIALNLTGVELLDLQSDGVAIASGVLKQNHSLDLQSDGVGEAEAVFSQNVTLGLLKSDGQTVLTNINLGVFNGILSAKSNGLGLANLSLGQSITNILFMSDGIGNLSAFFRLNDEPNRFLDGAISNGVGLVLLNLSTEQLASFKASGVGQAQLSFPFELIEPEPILTEIPATAFQNQNLRARFFVHNTELPIKSFEFSKPKGTVGSSLNVTLAKADLAQIPADAIFRFQIGKFISGNWQYFTLIENAVLDSRSYALAFLNDTLSFSSIAPLADKLELCPRSNLICYDSNSVELSLDNTQPIYDILGNQIATTLRSFNQLSLYALLEIAFVEGCGFADFETNIPNFLVSRADFSFTSSYLEAIGSIIGIFEPVIFEVDNVIWILDKTQAIPEGFEPNTLTASRMTTYGANKASQPLIDGFLMQYTDSEFSANTSVNRLVQFTNSTGNFGDDNYTETEITQTFKDWKHTSNPNIVVKSDLISEKHETFVGSELVGRTIETNFYDGQGKRVESRKTIEALVPSLPTGAPSLQTVREEITEFFYKNDRFNSNRFVLDKSILRISGLIAIDSENQYFDADFKQDFVEANKAGNLTAEMTSETGNIKTVIETLENLGNGQVQTKIQTIDHLRNSITNSFSDVKSGDNSINSISKPRSVVVWRNGINLSSTKGARIQSFAVGELPLFFAIPLAKRRLARQLEKPQDASIEILGFDENLERGVYFRAVGRNNAVLGDFLTEGYSIRQSDFSSPIVTVIEASEI